MTRRLYRAKRKDNGAWVEGYYVLLHKTTVCCGEEPEDNAVHQIVYEHMTDWNLPNKWYRVEVVPETVCEFTGMTDRNGKMIFENDIVLTQELSDRPYSARKKTKRLLGVVKYIIGDSDRFGNPETGNFDRYCCYSAEWRVDKLDKEDTTRYRHGVWGDFYDCIVVGNVFDDQQWLGGEHDFDE